jgi:hypothetical protein
VVAVVVVVVPVSMVGNVKYRNENLQMVCQKQETTKTSENSRGVCFQEPVVMVSYWMVFVDQHLNPVSMVMAIQVEYYSLYLN